MALEQQRIIARIELYCKTTGTHLGDFADQCGIKRDRMYLVVSGRSKRGFTLEESIRIAKQFQLDSVDDLVSPI